MSISLIPELRELYVSQERSRSALRRQHQQQVASVPLLLGFSVNAASVCLFFSCLPLTYEYIEKLYITQ